MGESREEDGYLVIVRGRSTKIFGEMERSRESVSYKTTSLVS
jgi:hypothetical protein